jgi:hypothetical protein
MTTQEALKLIRALVEREYEIDRQEFIEKLRGIDKKNEGDTIKTIVEALGLEDFFEEIGFNIYTMDNNKQFNEKLRMWQGYLKEKNTL